MRVLVLGASGMLGRALMNVLGAAPEITVHGTVRVPFKEITPSLTILNGIDVMNEDDLLRAFISVRPQVVVNAVGLIKQIDASKDPLRAVPINTLLPHRLARMCGMSGARLVHISTDCVFNGDRGNYVEADRADATDLHGLSKYLGEVTGVSHALTLRTSIIGREATTRNGLVEWFLSAGAKVKGYRRAVFSGLPTVALAEVIRDHVLPNSQLSGLFHLGAAPINKFELLKLLALTYDLDLEIEASDEIVIDRSLDSTRFRRETGFTPAAWPEMVTHMRELQG